MLKYIRMRSRWTALKISFATQKYEVFLRKLKFFESEYALKPHQVAMKGVALLLTRDGKSALNTFCEAYDLAVALSGPDAAYVAAYSRANILALKGQKEAALAVEMELDKIKCDGELRRLLPHK